MNNANNSNQDLLPKETLVAIAEAEEISARMTKGQYRFDSFESMLDELNRECAD